jgi:hypothetical protein
MPIETPFFSCLADSFAMYNVEKTDPYLAAKFVLPNMDSGHFHRSSWVTSQCLAGLTRLGKLMVFDADLTGIRLKALITPLADNPYISISSYSTYLLVGDSLTLAGSALITNRTTVYYPKRPLTVCNLRRIVQNRG